MAVVQSTGLRVKIEPHFDHPDYDYGPSDSVRSDAVPLTWDFFASLGAPGFRVGVAMDVKLWVYNTVSGVETAMSLSGYSSAVFNYWDPITLDVEQLTAAIDADQVNNAGLINVTAATPTNITPGIYQFAIQATHGSGDVNELMSGWIQFKRTMPVYV